MPRNNFDDRDDSADFQMNDSAESRPLTFGELGVPGPLVRVLAADDKKTAFPIQADTLPDSLAGRDILGRGRTGSGKTLAFSIPLITRLGSYDSLGEIAMEEFRKEIKRRKKASLEERRADDFLPHPRGLVLAPTRELANQINDVLMPLAHTFGMNTTTVYGGVKYIHQIRDLKAGADIVVACPGRLEDLLRQQALTLSSVEVVVIDEADEMADMGFLPPVKRLLEQISPDAQHMLFSATLDHGVDEVVNTFLHDPKVHEVDSATTEPDLMTHHVFETTRGDKHELVRVLASGEGRRILFTRTKFQAKKLAKNLTQNGIPAAELHGNLNQNQRDRNLAAFDSGDVRVMVATDVAARGIDVGGVELVVQVEPPADPKSFVHRSGRTARAGKAGDVVTLVLPEQRREARRLLNQAGIKTKMIEVTHDSPEVLELVGDRAERVDGWSLDKSQPVGNPRKGKNRGAKNAAGDESGRSGRRKHNRNRDRAEQNVAETGFQHENAGGEFVAEGEPQRKHGDKASKKAVKKNRNRAERRAGMSNPEAERRDYLFEHGDDRRKGGRRDGYGKNRYDERQDDGRNEYGKNRRNDRYGKGGKFDKRIHRKNENRIVRDERSEGAKRHERRMIAKYGNTEGPNRRHSKKNRNNAPFRMKSGRR
ncbi:DEAD/DEAH box helicase [Bifidobacterium longum]|uniref:DEAD/DEAH box helicase n=1 Tax=Bifidobacterium longum TaxID=216816 RepID=UPI0018D039BD|nr:DEAD/DEAH box helicase [Bifidobacterium longum]MBH0363006.1 DEAD/DEAH box helicase [Bifidobacterium longum]MBM5828884.1 DEAD/DEAH box helicase [Bifidobacterium longum subsp. suillum]MEE1472549.1 DEAD/DEAH box helicase [Bifidobacterium longum]QSG86701.1 DEAD/DEAH box helicase [Bifidobacterium longum subsp. suillum]QXT31151.1 DEAD/DEAH box helicase [Bifidobacterium longum subsp. suillum]